MRNAIDCHFCNTVIQNVWLFHWCLRRLPHIVEQEELLTRFGNRLRLIRKKAKISQEALADLANMSRNAMSSIENGKINISFDTLRRIANALQVPLFELMPDYADKEQ
jgi:DNA-binding XRE family transcriptional regulator